jgi:hypothetical protein
MRVFRLIHAATALAALAARAARAWRLLWLTLSDGDDRHLAFEILRLAGRTRRLSVSEDQFFELVRTFATQIFV